MVNVGEDRGVESLFLLDPTLISTALLGFFSLLLAFSPLLLLRFLRDTPAPARGLFVSHSLSPPFRFFIPFLLSPPLASADTAFGEASRQSVFLESPFCHPYDPVLELFLPLMKSFP